MIHHNPLCQLRTSTPPPFFPFHTRNHLSALLSPLLTNHLLWYIWFHEQITKPSKSSSNGLDEVLTWSALESISPSSQSPERLSTSDTTCASSPAIYTSTPAPAPAPARGMSRLFQDRPSFTLSRRRRRVSVSVSVSRPELLFRKSPDKHEEIH